MLCEKGPLLARHNKNVTYSSHPTRAARAAHARGDKEFRTYDTSAIVPKRDMKPVIFLGVVALIIVAAVVFFVVRGCTAEQPQLLEAGQTAQVTIEEGESAQAIGEALAAAHLVPSAQDFTNEVTRLEAASALIPGTYTFEGGMTPEELVRAIMAGPAAAGDTLTVPEGLTLAATADAVAEATGGRISAEDFTAATADASVYAAEFPFLESVGTNSLEGFLFPKTYAVTDDMDAAAVARMMLTQFGIETASLFDDFANSYPASQGLSFYDAVKLASVVEKESSGDEEVRARVARVFYNRLASDHPYLESDATTAYEVGHDPSAEEVHADTPYSTYTHEGLPPTPICSPGLECLMATFNPAEGDDLFFYFYNDADGNLQYVFSQTYEEHQAAIAEHPGDAADGAADSDAA